MDIRVYGLVLFGGLVQASYFVLLKKLFNDRKVDAAVASSIIAFGSAVIPLAISLVWDRGLVVNEKFWLPFFATALLNIVIVYGGVKALSLADASLVSPISAATPMFVIVMSYIILGEWPSAWGRVGIILIALGSYVLNLQAPRAELPSWVARHLPDKARETVRFFMNPWLHLFSNAGVRIALGVAYVSAIAVNFDKLATINSNPFVFTGGVYSVVAIATAIPKFRSPEAWRSVGVKIFIGLIVVGVLQGCAAVLYNTGYFYGIVPYVSSLKRTQILWTVLFAGIFLSEKQTRSRLLGAFILFAGAALLAF